MGWGDIGLASLSRSESEGILLVTPRQKPPAKPEVILSDLPGRDGALCRPGAVQRRNAYLSRRVGGVPPASAPAGTLQRVPNPLTEFHLPFASRATGDLDGFGGSRYGGQLAEDEVELLSGARMGQDHRGPSNPSRSR